MEITRLSKFFLENYTPVFGETILDYGSRQGEIAASLDCAFADHRLSNETAVGDKRYVSRGQDLQTNYDAIVFTAQFSTALNLQLVRELLSILAPGCRLYVLLERNYTITPFDELMIPYTMTESAGGEKLLTFTRWDGPIDAAEKPARYTHNVGERVLYLAAGPGVFSGEKLDAGTEALLHVVKWNNGRVLDLGCGNGVVGLVASLKGAEQVMLLDSDLRALRWAEENALRNGVKASVVASSGLKNLTQGAEFDLIISNPPYHSDYSVAKSFIEEGYRHLSIDGSIWLVVKNAEWYRNKVKTVFGGARVYDQDGYMIVTAEKRALRFKPAPEPKTTRKHAKRMARSKA